MRFVITPTYESFFKKEDNQSVENYLKNIPTSTVIIFICYSNFNYYQKPDDIESQLQLLHNLIIRQSIKTKSEILNRFKSFFIKKRGEEVSLFSPHISLELLHYALINFVPDNSNIDSTPEEELNLLKAYYLTSDNIINQFKINDEAENKLDYFRKNIWPYMIRQIEVNHSRNYFYDSIKTKAFFDFLKSSSYSEMCYKYLNKRGFKSPWDLIFQYMNTVKSSLENKTFLIKSNTENNHFYEQLAIDINQYKSEAEIKRRNYNGFKKHPLIKKKENEYYVIDWNIFTKNIYNGILFDFFKREVENSNTFKNFNEFKSFIGIELTEKYIFQKIIKSVFNEKHNIVLFDDKGRNKLPDSYIRIGNKIFIIELKDVFFPSKAIESIDYETIKNVIDEKFNSNKKGIGQIIKHLEFLKTNEFDEDNVSKQKIKKRNITIYPILIFTDDFFELPGIQNYLNEEFEIKTNHLSEHFKNIKPLSFINFTFFLEHINILKSKNYRLDKIIDYYSEQIKKKKNRYRKSDDEKNLHSINEDFFQIVKNFLPPESNKSNVKDLLYDLDLINDLK